MFGGALRTAMRSRAHVLCRAAAKDGASAGRAYGADIPLPKAGKVHKAAAAVMGGTMWFWVLYRMKHDGKAMLGMEHPWDGHH